MSDWVVNNWGIIALAAGLLLGPAAWSKVEPLAKTWLPKLLSFFKPAPVKPVPPAVEADACKVAIASVVEAAMACGNVPLAEAGIKLLALVEPVK